MGNEGELVEKREPGPEARDNIISTGLPPDLYRDFEEYRAENDITSTSDAGRRLIRSGIEADNSRSGAIFAVTGATVLGIAVEPVAPPEIFVGFAAVLFVLSIAVQKDIFRRVLVDD